MLAQFDQFQSARPDPRSVASMFAEQQIAAMRADKSEEEAYGAARAWMIDNGRDVLLRMGVLTDEKTAAAAAQRQYEAEMAAQVEATRAALRAGLLARQSYRSFLQPEEAHAVATRSLSGEPVLPRGEDGSDGEGRAGQRAGGAAAPASASDEADILDSAEAQRAAVGEVLGRNAAPGGSGGGKGGPR